MKTAKSVSGRYEMRRRSALRQIAHIQPFIEGALCAVKRRGCKAPGWQLAFKVKGKTQTVYVPMDMAKDVAEWTKEFKRLKKQIRQVTRQSLGIIRKHVARRRAANRIQA